MTASDIREHVLSRAPWVDRASTVDTVKIGDPDRPVTRVGVGWMAAIWKCRAVEPGRSKREWLQGTGMVVLRCHDAWDASLGVGVVMLEHGTTEMWGIESLARYLAAEFPSLTVRYYDRHPRSWHVPPSGTP